MSGALVEEEAKLSQLKLVDAVAAHDRIELAATIDALVLVEIVASSDFD